MSRRLRPSYQRAIDWIARNDEPEATEAELVDLISVLLVADLWNKNPYTVAHDIIKSRCTESPEQS